MDDKKNEKLDLTAKAREIIDVSVYRLVGNEVGDALVTICTAALAAERKAGREEVRSDSLLWNHGFDEGFRTALEEAAEIVEEEGEEQDHIECHCGKIAERIRKLADQ
jgi:hypothetical protein